MFRKLLFGAILAAGGVSTIVAFAETPATPSKPSMFRASTIESLKVRNSAGDNIGKIKDLVIDARTGKVSYAVLDFGGFLGVGDKMFAVPWHALKYQTTGNDEHLLLDVSKERLKEAPGFDKNHWPDMADPQWKDLDKYYGAVPAAG